MFQFAGKEPQSLRAWDCLPCHSELALRCNQDYQKLIRTFRVACQESLEPSDSRRPPGRDLSFGL